MNKKINPKGIQANRIKIQKNLPGLVYPSLDQMNNLGDMAIQSLGPSPSPIPIWSKGV